MTSFSLDNNVLLSNGNEVVCCHPKEMTSHLLLKKHKLCILVFLVLFCYFEQHVCYGNHEINNKKLITLKNVSTRI